MNKQIVQKPERPDKSLFSAMMGVFFLLFAIAPVYWAFYNFGEYRRTTEFLQELKGNFDKNSNPEAGQEYSERTVVFKSRADRYRLEMILSGLGAFALLGFSALLFGKSWRVRNRKIFYENINPQMITLPNGKIEIRYKKLYDILFVLLALFFGAMMLIVLYQSFTNRFISPENAVIRSLIFAVPIILTLAVILFLLIRAKHRAVKFIDISGIKRNDGRLFSWNEFCGTITQTAFNQRTQKTHIWRTELVFSDGETAWLIPNRIKNYDEVFAYIERLPAATPKT